MNEVINCWARERKYNWGCVSSRDKSYLEHLNHCTLSQMHCYYAFCFAILYLPVNSRLREVSQQHAALLLLMREAAPIVSMPSRDFVSWGSHQGKHIRISTKPRSPDSVYAHTVSPHIGCTPPLHGEAISRYKNWLSSGFL